MKKRISLLLAGLLALSAVSCAANSGTSTNNSTQTNNSRTTQVSEPTPLTIHYHSENKHVLVNEEGVLKPVFQLAEKGANVVLECTANPVSQNSAEEFQLQASKKFPADIYGGNSIRDGVFAYAHQGAFLPLNDLIDQYAPNVKKYLEENPEVRKAMTDADGNIYMLNYVPDGDVARVYVLRTDWLKQLGYEEPKTLEELETILRAFRDEDPNGNGLKDEIPVFNDKYEEMIRLANLWGARVYGADDYKERIVMDDNGKFYHAWTHDDFKIAMEQLAGWYAEGLIDPEVFTRKANTARQTLWTKENTGGMTHEWLASTTSYNYNEELLKAVPDFKVEAFLPPAYNGNPGFEEHRRAVIKPDGLAISANCKNPEAAMRFLDWFYTEEGNRAINFGVEGESYTMVDGKPQFTPEVLSQTGVNLYIQTVYGAQYKVGYQQDYEYEHQWTVPEGQAAYDLYQQNKVYTRPATPMVNFTAEERELYDQYITGLNTYLDEMVQGFITGKHSVEKEWDTYVAKCEELGSQKLVELYQNVYDERYK